MAKPVTHHASCFIVVVSAETGQLVHPIFASLFTVIFSGFAAASHPSTTIQVTLLVNLAQSSPVYPVIWSNPAFVACSLQRGQCWCMTHLLHGGHCVGAWWTQHHGSSNARHMSHSVWCWSGVAPVCFLFYLLLPLPNRAKFQMILASDQLRVHTLFSPL